MISFCCCRTALLEQMKQQNGLQNGHVHTNGHANGDAEHTLNIGVQPCFHSPVTLAPDAPFKRADIALGAGDRLECFAVSHSTVLRSICC